MKGHESKGPRCKYLASPAVPLSAKSKEKIKAVIKALDDMPRKWFTAQSIQDVG